MDENSEKGGLFNRVRDSFKSGTRPGFLGGDGGGEAPSGSKAEKRNNERASANGAAAGSLKDAEDNASGGWYRGGDNLDETRQNEQEGGSTGFYRGGGDKVSRAASAAKDIKKGNFKGAVKKVGPFAAIFLVIFIVGGIMAGTQAFQPFSLVAQIQESFNSMHPSAYTRSVRIIRYQLSGGTKRFALSEKQIAEYEKHGIKYNDQFDGPDGNKIRVFEYDTDGGQHRIVTADADTAAKLRANGVAALSIDAAESDTTFNQKFTAASQTWRGQFANWFGTKTNKFLKDNKMTRNLWKDYKQKAAEADASGKSRLDLVKEMISNKVNGGEGGGVSRLTENEDDSGNKTQDYNSEKGSKVNAENIRSKLDSIKSKMSGGGGVLNIGCAVADFVGAVNLMVAAAEAAQIIQITTSYMEAVDKTKAGYGDEAPINEIANTLNEQVKQDHEKIVSGGDQTISEDGASRTISATSEPVEGAMKSAMQSAGMAALFGDGLTNPNDPSVQSFNLTSSINTLMGGIGMRVGAFQSCAIARAAAAVADATATVAGCVLTLGAGCVVSAIKDFGLGAATAVAIQGIIMIITPWITSALERDLISTLAGEDLGNALASGGNMYQGLVHKTNGGSLSTRSKYEEFAIARQQVIAQDAREERESLSPFDMTSKNTFMGAIMNRMMDFMTTNSLMGSLVKSSSVMSSSLTGLTPSTSAIASQIAESLPTQEQYEQVCPYLASIGAVGDSFCNPYMVTDLSTIGVNPDEVIQTMDDWGQLSKVGDGAEVKIKKDSELANYIEYCGERVSAFGVADQNIANNFKASTGNSVADAIVGVAPIIGDAVDIFDGEESLKNIGYISGESCVAGNDLDQDWFATASPKWGDAKYYQRFIEDQSLAESMGIVKKSAVAAYLEEYYEENPLDESYEGQLARWSGLDKETVSDMMDVIAYYNYIDAYDASERYAFGVPVVDESEKVLNLENEYVMDGVTVALEGVVYADVRNRNFVA